MRRASVNRDKSPTTERVSYSTPDFNLQTLWNLSDDEEERACVSFDWRRLVSLFPFGVRAHAISPFQSRTFYCSQFPVEKPQLPGGADRGGGVEWSRAVKFRLVAALAGLA